MVLSGFSLAVAPARAHRRAWRILPPYWPALLFSVVIAWVIVPQPQHGEPTAKSVVIFGLLLQDVFGAPSPNGAFWSIAVEAQLYSVLLLLLLVMRRAGAVVMLGLVAVPVLTAGILAPSVSIVNTLMRFTPQFAVAFALGVAVPVLVLIVLEGSVWTVERYFWVDLAIAPSVALPLAAAASGRPRPLVRLLDTRPIRGLGSLSDSLYLTHAPVVVVPHHTVVAPNIGGGVRGSLITLAVAVPHAPLSARQFAAVFEHPFQRHRTWPELRAAIHAHISIHLCIPPIGR